MSLNIGTMADALVGREPKAQTEPKARKIDAITFVGRSWRRLQGRLSKEPLAEVVNVLPRLPAELVEEVASNIPASDILNMCLTCSRWHSWLLPELYNTVMLRSFSRCKNTLLFLHKNRRYCHWIRTLVVRPYNYDWPRLEDKGCSKAALGAMAALGDVLIAISKDLTRLIYFGWEGGQLADNSLWNTLYASCPGLKGISANVGSQGASISRQLYATTNLTRFSLIVGEVTEGNENWLIPQNELPTDFWTLILTQCPALEQLAISSKSPYQLAYNFSPVVRGNWPRLKGLTLGPFGFYTGGNIGPSLHHDEDFVSFLAKHRTLEELNLLWELRTPLEEGPRFVPFQRPLGSDILPNLKSFTGIWQQAKALPNLAQLQELHLTCQPLEENQFINVAQIIKQLPNLCTLEVAVDSINQKSSDSMLLFKAITSSCPKLKEFSWICREPVKASLQPLLAELKPLNCLRRVSLTKAFKGHLSDTAISLMKTLPSLNEVALRWLDKRFGGNVRQVGLYTVLVNPNSRQRVLHIDEIGLSHEASYGATGSADVAYQSRNRYRHRLKLTE